MSAASNTLLPSIPDKRYFPIGEASDLCGVKAHVLRYWEQEFPQLAPPKRRGNRRYYRVSDIKTARRIRELLYDDGFTVAGAKAQLARNDARPSHTAGIAQARRAELGDIRAALEEIQKKLEQ